MHHNVCAAPSQYFRSRLADAGGSPGDQRGQAIEVRVRSHVCPFRSTGSSYRGPAAGIARSEQGVCLSSAESEIGAWLGALRRLIAVRAPAVGDSEFMLDLGPDWVLTRLSVAMKKSPLVARSRYPFLAG